MSGNDRLSELERENAELRARLDRLEGKSANRTSSEPLVRIKKTGAPRAPVREWMLDILNQVQVPLYSQYLSAFYTCQFGKVLPPNRFGSLAADERKRFESGRAPAVVLVHGLSADHGTAIKRIWGRSDWPLAERVIADKSGRILFLKTVIWLFGQAAGDGKDWAEFETLKLLARQLARDLNAEVRHFGHRGGDDFNAWAALARSELLNLEADDRVLRSEAAFGLQRLTPVEQRFGANPPLTLLPGTEEQAWKVSKS